ncbi:MAG: DUF1080 domain-containing protein [Acidobacteria bacterium]|nr:DUF1080 domain-containing protein [Acidobacteriota bacterium]
MNRRSFLSHAAAVRAAFSPLAASAGDGLTPLFDGKTLDGWIIREGPQSAFYVDHDGAIVVHHGSNFPTWLSSNRQYENFDLRLEFFVKGWIDSALYLHAPEHGRPIETGLAVKLFHKQDQQPRPESMGAIFPTIPPQRINVRNQAEWNTLRVLMDWPSLKLWTNGELVQDLDLSANPELRYRLRRGYLGFLSLSYPIRFRNIQLRELPAREQWQDLYTQPGDLAKWKVYSGKPKVEALGEILRLDELGYCGTAESYRDFELQMYVRASRYSNGGVYFRVEPGGPPGEHYEIQIHDVEGAVYPTGSLYQLKRATYPKIEPEQWFLFHMIARGRDCLVRINGETVMEYHELDRLVESPIMVQAHQTGKWIEYKQIRVKRL